MGEGWERIATSEGSDGLGSCQTHHVGICAEEDRGGATGEVGQGEGCEALKMENATRWKISASKDDFDRLKQQPSFCQLLALSRLINALRFVHAALGAHHEDEDSPGATRVRYNSFMFNCALLAEGELLVRRMHKHFGKRADFQEIAKTLNTGFAKNLLPRNLRPVRNTLVFHFDENEIARQLKDLDLDDPIYVSGLGNVNKQTHHELADLCAVRSFSGSTSPSDQEIENLVRITTEVTSAFLGVAETFISAVLSETGWRFIESSESA